MQTHEITKNIEPPKQSWFWHAESREWHDAAKLGRAARYAPDAFGYTHYRSKGSAAHALKEACDWIENRLAVEGHPVPASMSLLVGWRSAIQPPPPLRIGRPERKEDGK